MSRRAFISDIHMSAGIGLGTAAGKHPWEWFTVKDRDRLCWFIEQLLERPSHSKVDELVLLGDIFDNWVFPHDVKPPTFAQIVKSSHIRGVLELLDRLSESTAVLFIPGNHDMTLTHAELMSVLPRVGYGGQGKDTPMFGAGRLLAEHGNAAALFCAPDPQHPNYLPLGYFISRLAATADRETGSHSPSVSDIVREFGHMLAKEKLAVGVFDAICHKAGVSGDATILMPEDLWGGEPVTVAAVRDSYKDLQAEYERRHGLIQTALAIPSELGELSLVADTLFIRHGAKLVLMGHTHHAVVKQHVLPTGRVAYVNTGAWCNDTSKATWVEVEKTQRSYSVAVMSCQRAPDGGALTVEPQFEPFTLDYRASQ
jgi:UDP-2,3-diacylglucosamine pyrophosphatase LpxH